MRTKKLKWSTDCEGTWLAALVSKDDAMYALQGVEDGIEYELEIKKSKGRKRSLDANAYCWVLIDKLASHYGVGVKEIYRSLVRDIGGNSEIVCIRDKAVDSFRRGWEKNGIGWQTETFPSKLEGCTNVKIYYGSSTYDTTQMSRFIDSVVQECHEAGIETLPQNELERLTGLWAG